MSDRMDRVEYQLWENGGNSMKDQMNDHGALAKQTAVEVKFIKDVLLQLLSMPEMHQGPAPVEPKMVKTRKKKNPAAQKKQFSSPLVLPSSVLYSCCKYTYKYS